MYDEKRVASYNREIQDTYTIVCTDHLHMAAHAWRSSLPVLLKMRVHVSVVSH